MPPKKKKNPVNLVVGTVSTRSTRRQSIVNIEIPKLSRSGKSPKVAKATNISKKPIGQEESDEFTNKIKVSYNKFITSNTESPPLSPKAPQDALDKDNKALLEILQDWNDEDEEQIENVPTSSMINDIKPILNKNVEKQYNLNETKDVSDLSENKQMELMLSEGLDDEEILLDKTKETIKSPQHIEESDNSSTIKDDFKLVQDDSLSEDVKFEATKDDNSVSMSGDSVHTEPEQVIIEENASIPFADDMIVDEVQLTEKFEESNMSEQDNVDVPSEIVAEEIATLPEDIVIEETATISEEIVTEGISEENIEFSEVVQIAENISEDSQSKSDEEQIVVAKIEEIHGVNDESQDMDCMPVVEQLDEIQTYVQEDMSNLDSLKSSPVEEKIEESNIIHSPENIGESTPLQEEEEVEKMECEYETIVQTDEVTDCSENKEEVECKSSENNQDTQFNFSSLSKEQKEEIYENLESKVAEMNLADENLDKKCNDEIINATENTYYDNVMNELAENENVELVTIDISSKKSPIKKDKNVKMEVTKQPSTKKTKSTKSKVQKADIDKRTDKSTKTKSTKLAKPPTFKINKDKKPTEFKNKNRKNINEKSTKKCKEKSNLKEPDKLEKKSDKKLTKFEEALQCLAKVEIEGEDIRRSSRIKSISVMNKKTSGWGLVKSKSETSLMDGDASDSNSFLTESDKSTPTASPKVTSRDRKSKSGSGNSESPFHTPVKSDSQIIVPFKNESNSKERAKDPVVEARLKQFVHLKENLYKTDRMVCKEAKKMACDCFLTQEELDNSDYYGCGEDCLNRLLLIECGNLCTVGDRCTNKRFQKNFFAPIEVFNTDKKGLGLRAAANIPFGEFILEYVGEVLNSDEFDKRAEVYSQDKNIHYYFMALRADAIIDATMKGNISRFINHSCDPNAETQKWTVNGELRIGFFSTRTILAGEEITFDYRFQRYGKEAQKCYCGASICRGWLGEQPDSDEEEEEEEEEIEETKPSTPIPPTELEAIPSDLGVKLEDATTVEITAETPERKDVLSPISSQDVTVPTPPKPPTLKKKVPKKKSRIELFEEVDQLNEEIEMLVTTGLKNQAHTLKLSRLMVRAKEPQQRAKLLRVLRRGELPCRRLFLDYHGLRLMHGYMIDAQQLVLSNKKFESSRLEMLQTLAVLPIPNKTMLQDSKVLPTVEKWSTNKDLTSAEDSESNSPKDAEPIPKPVEIKEENKDSIKEEQALERTIEDQQEEIKFLATKLLEEWKNLKEVFRIPKKERIEQMKEHEREANKKFMQTNQNNYGSEDYRKMDRYRGVSKGKMDWEWDRRRRPPKPGDKPSAEYLRLSKIERRKLFALQHELREEERKLKQRELWRQHETNCMMIGADPRFTAPFDPSRGYQYIWNQQIAQWQTVPIQDNPRIYPSQPSPHQRPNLNLPPPHLAKPPPLPPYQYPSPISLQMPSLPQNPVQGHLPPLTQNPVQGHLPPLPQNPVQGHLPPLPQNPVQGHLPPLSQNPIPGHLTSLSHIPVQGHMPPLPGTPQIYHAQAQMSVPTPPPLPQIPPPQQQIEEDPSQVKFMGPIPPPVKLPPKWKCAKDKYGRPYYYHIKIRRSQWEPPPPPEPVVEVSESESSSESSTVSSDSSSENSDSDDDIDDTRLLLEVRRQMDSLPKPAIDSENMDDTPTKTPSPDEKHLECDLSMDEIKQRNIDEDIIRRPSIDMRLKELDLFKDDRPVKKKRRVGLCEEIIISPRTEEDKKQFKEDLKRYKANKEKLKRQKEKILMQTKKQLREIELKKAKEKKAKTTVKVKLKEKPDFNSEAAKKIKESFRTNMASTVVSALNAYRKPDCTEGRITNTQDFKHLARKLTHFVMLKEMKHITKIEDLTCTDNVKTKAREFIRKYMSKFGEVYVKRSDSPDFKD